MGQGPESADRVALAFLEHYWRDRGNGTRRTLAAYLELWPDHAEAITREYVVAEGGVFPREVPSAPDFHLAPPVGRIASYRLIRELGRGGQGTVHLAEDTRLGRLVALKVFDRSVDASGELLQRFEREAAVASRLEHPGICGVHEAGRDGGVAYIAMRYVDGETLAGRLQKARVQEVGNLSTIAVDQAAMPRTVRELQDGFGPQPSPPSPSSYPTAREEIPELVRMISKVARALHVAHEAGIVHRDIKPGNIIVTHSGEPVILDFGLARDSGAEGPTLTVTDAVFGTPAYMAPEQVRPSGRRTDRRCDVFALGVTLCELLTLRRPFDGPTREALLYAIVNLEAEDPRSLNPAITRDLATVILTALEKDLGRRYQSAAAFADDLDAVLEHRPIAARPISLPGRLLRWGRRSPARAALLLVLLLAVPTVTVLVTVLWVQAPEIRAQREARRRAELEGLIESAFTHLSFVRDDQDPRLELADAAFARALAIEPQSAEGQIGRGLVMRRRKDYAACLKRLSGFPPLRDGAIGAAYLVRSCELALTPDKEDAGEPLAMPKTALDHALVAMIEREVRQGEPPAAFKTGLELITRGILLSPVARPWMYHEWARLAGFAGDRAAAERVAQALTSHWPETWHAWFYAGYALQLAGVSEPAIRLYREALDRHGSDVDTHYNLGCAYQALGRPGEAIVAYRAALELAPADESTLHNLEVALHQCSQWAESLAVNDQLRKQRPDDVTYALSRAQCLIKLERFEDALAAIMGGPATWKENPKVLEVLGIVFQRLDRMPEAERVLRRWNETEPESPEAQGTLGCFLARRLGLKDEGLALCRKALSVETIEFTAKCRIAGLLSELGEHEEALAILAAAVATRPEDMALRNNYGFALEQAGRREESIAQWQAAMLIGPSHPQVHANILEAMLDLGRLDDAAQELERWDREKGSDGEGWLRLAVKVFETRAQDPQSYQQYADRAARRAVAITERKNPHALLALARVLLAVGSDEEAHAVAVEALRLPEKKRDGLSEDELESAAETKAALERIRLEAGR